TFTHLPFNAVQNNIGTPTQQLLDFFRLGLNDVSNASGNLGGKNLLGTRVAGLGSSLPQALRGAEFGAPVEVDGNLGQAEVEIEEEEGGGPAGTSILRRLIEEGFGEFEIGEIGEQIADLEALRAKLDGLDETA